MIAQTFTEIQNQFPNEWILIGNPVSEKGKVVTGVVILHSEDKKELYYLGKDKISEFNRITVVYTGFMPENRQIGILRRL
jgi:hypothetical protein